MKGKRNQLLATGGLVALGLVVGLIGLLVAVLPQRSQAGKLDTQIAAAQAKLAALEVGHAHGPVIRAAQLFQLARAMPNDVDMPGIVVDLARAAKQANVTILSVAPGAQILQPDGSSGTPLKLSVTGSWNGVDTFLRILRENVLVRGQKLSVAGRLFVVDQVSLTSGGASQAPTSSTGGPTLPTGEINASLNVNAFTYGIAPPPVPTDTTTGDTTTTTTTTTTTPTSGSAVAAGATG